MKDKKHIDELFKEKFQNFEATPSPRVWKNIQAKLADQKDDRKLVPLWLKLGGVAALLILLLTVGNAVFDPFGSSSSTLTDENVDSIENEDGSNNTDPNIVEDQPIEIADEDILQEDSDSGDVSPKDDLKPNDGKGDLIKKSERPKEAVAVENIDPKTQVRQKDVVGNDIIKDKVVSPVITDAIVNENTDDKKIDRQKDPKSNDKIIKEDIGITDTKDTEVAEEHLKDEIDKKKEDLEKEGVIKKKSIFDAIEENKEKEAVAKNNKPDNRWDVSPNVGPVYYNSISGGSSIDPSFADNSQTGDVNFSYGVNVSYNITDRLSLRTGVSNVDLSYSTGDIELGTGPVSSALRSIDYGGRAIVTTAVDKGTIGPQAPGSGPFDNIMPKSTTGEALLIQNISYYEVPFELKYALLNNKFGVNLIGGFSTLFLGNNEVSVQAGDFSEVLGGANNLNDVSFTSNFGLGFDYKISSKFKFNIEPMFKYQLNPYSDSSVSFKPYYFGVYSGFSFKF